MTRPSDEQLARDFARWSDLELREHWEASKREAVVQFKMGGRTTAQMAHACRLSAHRYEREMVRRAKERCAK